MTMWAKFHRSQTNASFIPPVVRYPSYKKRKNFLKLSIIIYCNIWQLNTSLETQTCLKTSKRSKNIPVVLTSSSNKIWGKFVKGIEWVVIRHHNQQTEITTLYARTVLFLSLTNFFIKWKNKSFIYLEIDNILKRLLDEVTFRIWIKITEIFPFLISYITVL